MQIGCMRLVENIQNGRQEVLHPRVDFLVLVNVGADVIHDTKAEFFSVKCGLTDRCRGNLQPVYPILVQCQLERRVFIGLYFCISGAFNCFGILIVAGTEQFKLLLLFE